MYKKDEIKVDHDKLKSAIAAGSIIANLIFFDYLTADEWYEKDSEGNIVLKRKDLIKEIFE
jgi:hypothetical protein